MTFACIPPKLKCPIARRSTGSELNTTNEEGFSIISSRCPSAGRSDGSEAVDRLGLASWIAQSVPNFIWHRWNSIVLKPSAMRVSIGHKISFPKGPWKRGCAAQRRRIFSVTSILWTLHLRVPPPSESPGFRCLPRQGFQCLCGLWRSTVVVSFP